MTFCQMYPPGRDISWPGLVLLQAGWPLVRCTPQAETSYGQLWSGWPLATCTPNTKIRLWVRLTFGQASGHADLWSDVPPKTSGDQVWYHISWLQWKTSFCLYLMRQLNWSHIWAHIILCKIWTWKDDWPLPGCLLHHERSFTQEGNYLV